jgi:hypothetical protein
VIEAHIDRDKFVRSRVCRPGPSWRVVLESAHLLRATAGDRDPRGPLQRGVIRRQLQHRVAAFELRRLRVGPLAHGPIAVDHDRRDALIDAAAEHPDAGVLRLLNDRVRRIRNGLQVFVREDHGGTRKRDQILGHRVDSFWQHGGSHSSSPMPSCRAKASAVPQMPVPAHGSSGRAAPGAARRLRTRARCHRRGTTTGPSKRIADAAVRRDLLNKRGQLPHVARLGS